MAIIPYLYYEDLPGALKWLEKAFGFKTFGPIMRRDGKLTHAAMKRGDAVVMMGYPGPKYRNPRHLKRATQSLYVMAKGVDKTFARARKAGAKVLEEPMNTEYGHRRCGVEDPEGHQWYFAEAINKPPRQEKRDADPKGPRRSGKGPRRSGQVI